MINNKMGIWFAPGTFPTYSVLEKISVTYPHLAEKWSREKVNQLYFSYKEGVLDKGLAVWPKERGEIAAYMRDSTGYGQDDVAIFLMTLQGMSDAGEIDSRFFNIELQKADPPAVENILTNIAKIGTGGLEKKFKNIKNIGILILIGIGIYFAWPALKTMRGKIKQRAY